MYDQEQEFNATWAILILLVFLFLLSFVIGFVYFAVRAIVSFQLSPEWLAWLNRPISQLTISEALFFILVLFSFKRLFGR